MFASSRCYEIQSNGPIRRWFITSAAAGSVRRAKLTDVVRKKKPTDDKMCIVTGGWYASSLERYFELFGDQLLVVLHDDI